MKIGLIVGAFMVILQLVSADSSAQVVAKYQPEKLAAMEGVFKTAEHTPMTIIGYPDMEKQEVKGLKIKSLLSFLTYRNFKTPVTGLDKFPKKNWPNVPLVFATYHIMIYCWGLMVLSIMLGVYFFYKNKIEKAKWTLILLISSVLFPYIANQVGWYTAEFGRQPWIVYHLLRTAEGVSRSVSAGQVLGSLIMFVVIYSLLFCLFIFLLNRKIQYGPEHAYREEVPPVEYRHQI
jgi:cytochrome d ubiquinol oxidase subunit I